MSTDYQHVGLPALIFSSVVSAFTPDNIAAFGPLAMVAILYMILGVGLGWIVRELFYVPRDFHYGILVVSICGCTCHIGADLLDGLCLELGYDVPSSSQCSEADRSGNLPIAVVQTVALGEPFDPEQDVELGVAYIS